MFINDLLQNQFTGTFSILKVRIVMIAGD